MAGSEIARVTGVEDDRPARLELEDLGRRHGRRAVMLVEERSALLVPVGAVGEVQRHQRLTLGHDVDEVALVHRRQGVVGVALLADGRRRLVRQALAARRARSVGGKDPGLVGQGEELLAQGVVQVARQLGGTGTLGSRQIRPPDVADEQGVAGQHAVGDLVTGALVHHEADRLWRVPRRGPYLHLHLTQADALTVGQPFDRELRLCLRSEADAGPRCLGELEMPGEEVSVEVGLDDPLDLEPGGFGVGEITRDVPLWVDHHRPTGRLVADQVRGVRQAAEEVLVEDQLALLPRPWWPRKETRATRTEARSWPLALVRAVPLGDQPLTRTSSPTRSWRRWLTFRLIRWSELSIDLTCRPRRSLMSW